MGDAEEKAARFLARIDKRATRRLRIRKTVKSVRLTPQTWELIDTHRARMGKTIPEFLDYAVWTVTRPYRQASRKYHEERDAEAAP